MARYYKFLSSVTNNGQRVLGINTRTTLVDRKIIPLNPNNRGFDVLTLPENANIQVTFPDCLVYEIPFRMNSNAFLEYLGINPVRAAEMFARISRDNQGIVDGEILYSHIKIHVGESLNEDGKIWQDGFEKGDLPNQVPPDIIMNWLGFQESFIADFNRLKVSASQAPGIMDDYLIDEASNKAFRDMDLIDYIFATLFCRITNLRSFNRAMKVYLNLEPE